MQLQHNSELQSMIILNNIDPKIIKKMKLKRISLMMINKQNSGLIKGESSVAVTLTLSIRTHDWLIQALKEQTIMNVILGPFIYL